MTNGFKYPKTGSYVRVHTKPWPFSWMNLSAAPAPEGIVKERRDKTVLELFNSKTHFSPLIELDRIVSIEYLDEKGQIISSETPVDTLQEPLAKEDQSWQVEGSKGKTYTVSKHGDQWSCTCVAGSFGRTCKHVQAKKEELSS